MWRTGLSRPGAAARTTRDLTAMARRARATGVRTALSWSARTGAARVRITGVRTVSRCARTGTAGVRREWGRASRPRRQARPMTRPRGHRRVARTGRLPRARGPWTGCGGLPRPCGRVTGCGWLPRAASRAWRHLPVSWRDRRLTRHITWLTSGNGPTRGRDPARRSVRRLGLRRHRGRHARARPQPVRDVFVRSGEESEFVHEPDRRRHSPPGGFLVRLEFHRETAGRLDLVGRRQPGPPTRPVHPAAQAGEAGDHLGRRADGVFLPVMGGDRQVDLDMAARGAVLGADFLPVLTGHADHRPTDLFGQSVLFDRVHHRLRFRHRSPTTDPPHVRAKPYRACGDGVHVR